VLNERRGGAALGTVLDYVEAVLKISYLVEWSLVTSY
jgi:hypothetical protein